ncbi:MAG: hemerythrin domain-containing protein [Actinoplanes sp.]
MPDPQTAADLDVVDLLLTQHARIEEQFLLVIGAAGEARWQAFDDLVRLLAVHETAEEEVVHPLSPTIADDADGIVDDRLQEERQAREMLAALIDTDVDSDGFESATANLIAGPALTAADRARDLVREAARRAGP